MGWTRLRRNGSREQMARNGRAAANHYNPSIYFAPHNNRRRHIFVSGLRFA
jgi:hypothetical protein